MAKGGLTPARVRGAGYNSQGDNEYPIASGYATKIHKGDPVMFGTAGTIIRGTTGSAQLGSFRGVKYTDPVSKGIVFSSYYPGGIVAGDIQALVADDPDLTFAVPADADFDPATIGHYAALNFTAGDDITGQSKVTVDIASLATAKGVLDVRVLRVLEDVNDVGDATTTLEVELAQDRR